MLYQIPKQIDSNKVFLVNRSQIDGRYDPFVYKESFRYISAKYENVPLSRLVYINPFTSFATLDGDDEISFVPMDSIDGKNGIVNKYKTKRVHDSKGFTRFKDNDLLWAKITPCMQNGKSAIVRDLLNGVGCGSTEFYIIRPKSESILIEYIHFLLHDDRVLKTAQCYFGGSAGQQRVPVSFLNSFSVPVLPVSEQQAIVKLLNAAQCQKRQKENDAQKLLYSINEYILTTLGITLSNQKSIQKTIPFWMNEKNNLAKEGRLFLTNFKEVEGERFDPLNTCCLGKQIQSSKYNNIALKAIAYINKGQAITSKHIVPGDFPVIAGGQSSPYSHNKYNYEGNVITVSASGAYAGFVLYHDYPIFASDCSVIRSKDESIFSTKFIYEVLKVLQPNIYKLQQGAGQPHVYPADLEKIYIPNIPIDMQNELCAKIKELRTKATKLQEEGKELVKEAKRKVEQLILG